jgi:hypothetical protein
MVEGDGRRKRRKKRHKHGRPRRHGTRRKQKCKPHSLARTCAGKCGKVKNNCKKTVDCGSCACVPPCPVCQSCDASSGQCTNLADDTACGEGLHCQDGQCVCDGTSCPNGCCQDGRCHVDENDACGAGGGSCTSCTLPQTCGGGGEPGVCGCTPITTCPPPRNCGAVDDGCGETLNCGDCSGTAQVCVNNVCTACSLENPCPDGGCCAGGVCIANGAVCDDGNACTINDRCQNGVCSGTQKVCDSPAECEDLPGTCQLSTGNCTYPAKTNGTRCGDKCAQACNNGVCQAGTPVTCTAGHCQIPGACDSGTGTCSPPTNLEAGTDCSSAVPCGRCNGNRTCVGCQGTDCCGTDGQCYGDGEPCRPGQSGFCCNRQCTCFFGGFCRVAPNGATCCCSLVEQECVNSGNEGTCQ